MSEFFISIFFGFYAWANFPVAKRDITGWHINRAFRKELKRYEQTNQKLDQFKGDQ